MWGLLPIESMYLACLVVNTYAVHGRTKVLRGVSKLAARPRSLKGTLLLSESGLVLCIVPPPLSCDRRIKIKKSNHPYSAKVFNP